MSMITVRHKRNKQLIPKHVRASALIPTLAYSPDDELFYLDDQTLGFGFMCQPLSGGDEKVQERVTGMLNQELPANTTLQFILYRSPDITAQMHRMQSIRDGKRHKLLTPVVNERIAFLQKYTMQPLHAKAKGGVFDNGLIQDLKLIVTCKIPLKGIKPTETEIEDVSKIRQNLKSSLNIIGCQPSTLTAKSYKRLMGTFLNWGANASWRQGIDDWEHDRPLCDQLFDFSSDVQVNKDHLQIGDTYVKLLSAKKFPPVYYFGNALTYVGDLSGGSSSVKENYMVVTNVFFPDSKKIRGQVERKRHFTINQAHGPMLKFVPILKEKKEGFDTLYEAINNGSRTVQLSYTVAVFAPTYERVQSAAISLAGYWRENRFSLLEDKYIALPMFINSLPLCADHTAVRDLYRYKTMTSEQAAVLVPIFGEWKGTGTFHTALVSRNGQLMSLSLHDSDTNKNCVIAAESGSGKSFWANELLLSYMSEGAKVWVIDAGKSYENLCDVLKGDFMQFGEGNNIGLNPFELVGNYEEDDDALVSLICTMASAKGLLDEYQVSSLKRIMTGLWNEHGQSMNVDMIANACLQSSNPRTRDIGSQLFAFTSAGNYGRFFTQNNMKFDSQFTVLELDELQGRKHLRQVILLQLIYQIQQAVFLGDRSQKYVLFVDEAWDMLKEGEIATFIEHAYRKFRKYGGSVIIATQSINDLYENAVGRAIGENSSSMHLLGQTSETIESVKREGRLAMSDGAFNMLHTVNTVSGVYSEIFIKSKTGMGIGRLIVGEFQKLLYSTDPVDVSAIKSHRKRGLEVPEAIRAVMRERGLDND